VYRCLCTNISHLLQETCSRDRQEDFPQMLLPKAPRPFFFIPSSLSLSWSWMDTSSDRAHVCLHITTIHISLPPLLLPETRLRPSLLERSLTTGCGAIARVGSVHHIASPSAMRRFSRGHVPGPIGGDRGNRVRICKPCCLVHSVDSFD
jgi:hypothetical protein